MAETIKGVGLVPGEVRLTPIDELVPWDRNPRIGDVDLIRQGMELVGFYGTVVVQAGTGKVLIGWHRLEAMRQLGFVEVPAYHAEVDDDEAEAINLADNRYGDLSHSDYALLAKNLQALGETFDEAVGTGYDDEAVGRILHHLKVPDLDALAAEWGEVTESDFWVPLRINGYMDDIQKLNALLASEEDDPMGRLRMVLADMRRALNA